SIRSVAQQTSGRGEITILVDRWHPVADSQCGELFASARKKCIGADDEPARSQLDQLCEDLIKVTFGAGIENMELQPEGASRCLQFRGVGLSKRGIGWVDKQSHDARRGNQLVQQLQPFRRYPHVRIGHARYVATWPIKTGDESELNWVGSHFEDDRNGRRGRLC